MTNKRLENKVALVVGGSTGIGRASAVAFAQAGAKVVVAGRSEKQGKETEAAIVEAGAEGLFIQTDVTNERSIRALIDQTVETFGRIDAAFNNAGIEGKVAPLWETNEDDF